MARLPQLIDLVAKTAGRDRASVEHCARHIRQAGFIATTKRGVGAARMTARDAANLVIGAFAAETAAEAIEAIPQFRALEQWYAISETDTFEGVFGRLKDAPTFGDALEVLIEDAPELLVSFGQYKDEAYGTKADKIRIHDAVRLVVEMSRSPAVATIKILRTARGGEIEAYAFHYMVSNDLLLQGGYKEQPESCDRKTITQFGLKTVLLTWCVLNESDAPDACPAGGLATP